MNKKVLQVAIIGMGGRGAEAYGYYMHDHKEMFNISAICDINDYRLEKWGKIFDIPTEHRFNSEDEFWKEKRGDVCFVTTQDRQHVEMAIKALRLGYNVVCEKPISDDVMELRRLSEEAKKANRLVMICHVLRYNVSYLKLKEILDSGVIGQVVSIDHTENVVYWHEAHSFVRGNWRNREQSTPMIMAKCCHDLDLLQYFANSKCKSVSSIGSLTYFKAENKPVDAADRCCNCKLKDKCPYSAYYVYLDMWKNCGRKDIWPFTLITDALPLSEEALIEAIEKSPYGRCVFACDNNVVDHQQVLLNFENGITATLSMQAFVKDGGRTIRFYGTLGELCLYEDRNIIELKPFRGEYKCFKLDELTDDRVGHGGGDHRLLDKVYDVFANGNPDATTALDKSIESHLMALAAEDSRLEGGVVKYIKDYR